MIRVSLADTTDQQERIKLLGSLVDSLTRCGRYLEAARGIDELDRLDPEMAYALQGRRCQLYLLAGELALFQAHSEELPPIARVPLADALVDLLPDEAQRHLEHVNEAWGDLVRVRLLAERRDERSLTKARELLEKCDADVVDEGPEWQSQRALAWASFLRATGESEKPLRFWARFWIRLVKSPSR